MISTAIVFGFSCGSESTTASYFTSSSGHCTRSDAFCLVVNSHPNSTKHTAMATDCSNAFFHNSIVSTTAPANKGKSQCPASTSFPMTIPAIRQTASRSNGDSPNSLFFIPFNVNAAKIHISFEITSIIPQIIQKKA